MPMHKLVKLLVIYTFVQYVNAYLKKINQFNFSCTVNIGLKTVE